MNRTLAAVAVAGLALIWASCGGSGASDASTPVAPSVQSAPPVAATSPTPAPSATATATSMSASAPAASSPTVATPAPSATAKATSMPTSAPATSSPNVATPASTPTTGSGGSQSEQQLLARGKVVFEKEAGRIGCQACHGLDGKGTVGPGPNIRGKSEGAVRAAIQGGVAMMSFIKLSDEDITAVAAYLQYLTTQP